MLVLKSMWIWVQGQPGLLWEFQDGRREGLGQRGEGKEGRSTTLVVDSVSGVTALPFIGPDTLLSRLVPAFPIRMN